MFFAAIVWSFIRGAARSLVELLYLASMLTAAMPLTSLLSILIPSTGLWMHTELDTLMVDSVALMLAVSFIMLAKATSQRVYHSQVTDSVWSYRPAIRSV